MEYRALYSGDHLSHGKFKYIDKWKSKTGKWVYKYAEDARDSLQNKKNQIRNEWNRTHRNGVIRPHRRNGDAGQSGGWHTANTQDSIGGYTHTRERVVTDDRGRKVRRKEYRDEGENRNANKNIAYNNAMRKGRRGKIGSAIMDLNDKYGPKKVDTIVGTDLMTGRKYVMHLTRNRFGGREVHADTYSYDPNEDYVLRKKTNRKNKHFPKNSTKERR